jgi:putative RNA 2'-phosphotransferase
VIRGAGARFFVVTDESLSKLLSLILRHQPERFGVRLNEAGWANVAELLRALSSHGRAISRDDLERVVRDSDKQRFALGADGTMIRARQGHSVDVALGYVAQPPPARLYHGTASRFLPSIFEQGLRKGERHHVHLSAAPEPALVVGARHGQAILLTVDASAMADAGYEFFRSDNGVWLTAHVPPRYLRVDATDD